MENFVRKDVQQLQNFIKSGNQFLKKVRSFFANSVREGKLRQDKAKAYFKEILHTILFQGSINLPVIEPESFFERAEFEQLSTKYPDVFQKHNTHLPTRPPYTVLLDVVVEVTKTRHIDDVLKCLLDLTEQMVVEFTESSKCGNVFMSTVISYCYFWDVDVRRRTTENYFGASVSCKGRKQKEIMIDILCFKTWHSAISMAVCIGNWCNKQAFRFPPEVQSTVLKINSPSKSTTLDSQRYLPSNVQIPNSLEISRILSQRISLIPRAPYERCQDMLTDINSDPIPVGEKHCEYGNCAECESLSQILYANPQLAKRLQFLNFSTEQMNELIDRKLKRLHDNLKSLGFNVEHEFLFYNPSA
uniref:uncharacterized protein n=1 Tax=Pristiophorus japonicus TaxID=55135 RepID=UPI00398EE8E2